MQTTIEREPAVASGELHRPTLAMAGGLPRQSAGDRDGAAGGVEARSRGGTSCTACAIGCEAGRSSRSAAGAQRVSRRPSGRRSRRACVEDAIGPDCSAGTGSGPMETFTERSGQAPGAGAERLAQLDRGGLAGGVLRSGERGAHERLEVARLEQAERVQSHFGYGAYGDLEEPTRIAAARARGKQARAELVPASACGRAATSGTRPDPTRTLSATARRRADTSRAARARVAPRVSRKTARRDLEQGLLRSRELVAMVVPSRRRTGGRPGATSSVMTST